MHQSNHEERQHMFNVVRVNIQSLDHCWTIYPAWSLAAVTLSIYSITKRYNIIFWKSEQVPFMNPNTELAPLVF